MGVTRIAITGGPCAGKSTGLAIIEQRLKDLGYRVFIMDEMATTVINSGLSPLGLGYSFQKLLVELQLNRDTLYSKLIQKEFKDEKVVIIYDRGILDGQAYCSEEEFESILDKSGVQRLRITNYYDGVFHLVTAAKGASEHYTKANNSARWETLEQAVEKDSLTLNCWIGHPHLRVINNINKNFDQKMTHLLGEIMSLLGEPTPLEIERKFLIQMPNIQDIEDKVKITKTEIVQTYLKSSNGIERRIRQRGLAGDYSYYYTEKRNISSGTRSEKERKIEAREYLTLLMEADTTKHQVRKDRYCFIYNDRYFELDIYTFWDGTAILEVEVGNLDESIDLPDFISVIKEVTDDERYKNSSLAVSTEIE